MSLRSLNVRLASLFSAVFLACSLLLFGITYALLSSSLAKKQERDLASLLLDYWALYQHSGLELFGEEITEGSVRAFLLRVTDPGANTLFLYLPPSWAREEERVFERLSREDIREDVRIKMEESRDTLRLTSLQLPDGSFLQVGINIEEDLKLLLRFRRVYGIIVAPLLLISFAGGFFYSVRSLKPIQDLIRVTRSIIETGKIDSRLPAKGTGDELDVLVQLFNRMLGKIESLITGMRDAMDNVAHDLRTPMTRLIGKAEMVLKEKEGGAVRTGAYREVLEGCMEEGRNMLTMLAALLDISEAETGIMRLSPEPLDLSALLCDMVELYQYVGEEKAIKITHEVPPGLTIAADGNRMRQVLSNLLDNAVKYNGKDGTVHIGASEEKGDVVIRIRDSGMGIPSRDLDRIWERFYRGDRSRSKPGLGLGLSLVKAIVESHGGAIGVDSREKEGTEFLIRMPVLRPADTS
jgi:signal transduction histidine kinase